jgi:lipopolysaccharide transport system permease protein
LTDATPIGSDERALAPAPLARVDRRRLRELVLHLAGRQITSAHRFTLLGWVWPLARQLAQLGVLVFLFTKVVKLHQPDYPVFVFSGLIAWTWFAGGVLSAAYSIQGSRHLVFQPGFPAVVIPAVAVVVPLVDVLLALPVLLAMLVASHGVPATVALLPLVVAVQLVLMIGIAWLLAAASVFLRDVQSLTVVAVTILFYVTPVFYSLAAAGSYEWVFRINPMATLVDAYRSVLVRGDLPEALPLAAVGVASCLIAVAGWAFFRRLEPRFVDEL